MTNHEKPALIRAIEAQLGQKYELKLAPRHPNALDGLMAYKAHTPKYALDDQGKLIGLNLAGLDLRDKQWEGIVDLLEEEGVVLQALNLSDNKLKAVRLLEKGAEALKKVDVSNNQIERFDLPKKALSVQELKLEENPITSPPPEVVQQGSEGVLAWFASFRKDESPQEHFLKEIKILLVGEGLAGKTSLLKKIKGLPFDEHESQTHGVNVESLKIKDLPIFKDYKEIHDVIIRIWDFGGQEIMHASHQFFLTHRSIYVFVLDSRTDNRKEYWLRHIEKFGGSSPAIVAINKMDENKSYSLEESTLNKSYPFIQNRFIKMSCKTGMGMEQLAQTLTDLIPETPLFKTPISESWLGIKNQLESETTTERYIDRKRFLEICEIHDEKDATAQNTLLRYLNSLGVVLHFQNLALQEFYVLDPHWVTIGVYKIINSMSIIDGILKEKDLDYILNKEVQKREEYDPSKEKAIQYSSMEQLYLLSIMKEFELLYEYQKGIYLVPDLLPKELAKPIEFNHEHSVEFIMEYDFLPKNVMSRFIIHMRNEIHDLSSLWRTGVYLSNKGFGCSALVRANEGKRRITISVNGNERRKREYFSIIRHSIASINDDFEGLQVTEKMPAPNHPEIEYEYEDLLGREEMGEDVLVNGKLKKRFSVSRDFLDKISSKEERQRGGHEITVTIPGIEENRRRLERIEKTTDSTNKKADAILDNQAIQTQYLDSLHLYAQHHQLDSEALEAKMKELLKSSADLNRINQSLEAKMDEYYRQSDRKDWQQVKAEMAQKDPEWKLKFKLSLLFMEFEKEYNSSALNSIKEEIRSWWKGERSFKALFIADDK